MKSNFAFILAVIIVGIAFCIMLPVNLLLWIVGVNNPWKKFSNFLDDLILDN